ncbi:MAG: hypothetical protein BV458_12245 [Thermoplasmata archaeon M9B2D]|nr:MAG: hypothetical protein BV458_12245 [Thermoplasmata archaeon M9B2D]
MKQRKPFRQTLIDGVDKRGKNECWLWKGPKRNGYGRATQTVKYGPNRKRRFWSAHRAYLIFVAKKKVPDDSVVCHVCDNPPCCNPSHLVVTSQKWNMHDMAKKGRKVVSRGNHNGSAKLTDKQVEIIKKALKARIVSRTEIRDRFNISKSVVSTIVNYTSWKHILPLSPIETVKNTCHPSPLSKRLRASIRKHGMTATARRLHWSVGKLRRLAYPLALGYEYRKGKM